MTKIYIFHSNSLSLSSFGVLHIEVEDLGKDLLTHNILAGIDWMEAIAPSMVAIIMWSRKLCSAHRAEQVNDLIILSTALLRQFWNFLTEMVVIKGTAAWHVTIHIKWWWNNNENIWL